MFYISVRSRGGIGVHIRWCRDTSRQERSCSKQPNALRRKSHHITTAPARRILWWSGRPFLQGRGCKQTSNTALRTENQPVWGTADLLAVVSTLFCVFFSVAQSREGCDHRQEK